RDVTTLLSQTTTGMAQQQERLQRWAELQVIYQRASVLADEHRFDEAIHELDALIARDADFPQAREKLAEIQKAKIVWLAERQARLDKLYQEVREALALAMNKADALLQDEPNYPDADGLLSWLILRRDEDQQRVREAALLAEAERQRQEEEESACREVEAQAAEKARLAAEEQARQAEARQRAEAQKISAKPMLEQARPSLIKRSENEIVLTLASDVEMIFMRVPAGKFLMGNTQKGFFSPPSDELPQHAVELDEYYVGKYPVTTGQFSTFLLATDYEWKASPTLSKNVTHPITHVNWHDAIAFCHWVGEMNAVRVRLPTEAEWEKAARGIDARMFSWGNGLPDRAHCNFGRNEKGTTSVGKYSPSGDSPYGCADLIGNVLEWIADWYDGTYYTHSPTKNPTGPTNGKYRVLRGGGWYSAISELQVVRRNKEIPAYYSDYIGFRCALTLAT
ncbi:MAG: SUMF1/EgtB/PvdO family nonheme iron enzyme, partial [Anaerolinea sp.]|nr:SUMF1/EgtB/PvdO family nonheme iron enzyme [Anaerolinea sp.]